MYFGVNLIWERSCDDLIIMIYFIYVNVNKKGCLRVYFILVLFLKIVSCGEKGWGRIGFENCMVFLLWKCLKCLLFWNIMKCI